MAMQPWTIVELEERHNIAEVQTATKDGLLVQQSNLRVERVDTIQVEGKEHHGHREEERADTQHCLGEASVLVDLLHTR